MNTETGQIRRFFENEEIKPPWIPINEPKYDQGCPICHGNGSYKADVTAETLGLTNREERRAYKGEPILKFLPCPRCVKM